MRRARFLPRGDHLTAGITMQLNVAEVRRFQARFRPEKPMIGAT